jgi:SHS2 domain-containing protein
MERPFEILEHTADVGIRAFGRTLPELYENAARGMLEVLLDPASVRPAEEEAVAVAGADAVELLVVWLHEILLRSDARKRVFAQARVSEVAEARSAAAAAAAAKAGWRLAATLKGEPLDRRRHHLRAEIKGVPYYGARVERAESGWMAEVYFDI